MMRSNVYIVRDRYVRASTTSLYGLVVTLRTVPWNTKAISSWFVEICSMLRYLQLEAYVIQQPHLASHLPIFWPVATISLLVRKC